MSPSLYPVPAVVTSDTVKTSFALTEYLNAKPGTMTNRSLDVSIEVLNDILDFIIKNNIFINTGSSSEYGFKKQKMSENDVLVPNSYYSAFKSSATLYCQFESINSISCDSLF